MSALTRDSRTCRRLLPSRAECACTASVARIALLPLRHFPDLLQNGYARRTSLHCSIPVRLPITPLPTREPTEAGAPANTPKLRIFYRKR